VLSSGRSLDYASSVFLGKGDPLYSNRSRVMLRIVEDSVGRHDFLLTPCSAEMFRILYGETQPHRGCFGNFAEAQKRRAAWVLLLLTPLYTFYAYKYDANIIFLSIWPWILHYFMKSVEGRGLRDAIWFGLCVGLALMSKYYAVILIATCFLAVLQHPARRTYFASASPYVPAMGAAVVFAPHVWWLVTHRAPPLRYLDSRLDWPWHWV